MDNFNVILAENIQKFRKQKGLTQEELADKLGVTYQAVSKWENAKSAPDIFFLPQLADVFECSIDGLFCRDSAIIVDSYSTAFPWGDDDVIRGVVCHGHKILTVKDNMTNKFTFVVNGDAKAVQTECNLTVEGAVDGGCKAGGSISIGGYANGGLNCGNNITIGGYHHGGINCGANVSCGGDIQGGINCGSNVSCHNLDAQSINCGGSLSAVDIHADKIKVKGNIKSETLNCQVIKKIIL